MGQQILLTILLRVSILVLIVLLIFALLKKHFPKLSSTGHRPRRKSGRSDCQPVSSNNYRRPDPLIYDQYYLMAQGIAVSWDNPDIQIELNGQPVDPHDLLPSTSYDIIARIWNGSTDAPVALLPVRFSYLSFGIGTQSHAIPGVVLVNLGVKGSASCPAYARQTWTTPNTPGHYCLQVEFTWFDDANPSNNLGQQNTDVRPLQSPNAQFTFVVGNQGRAVQRLTLRADGYVIPQLGACGDSDLASAIRARRIASQRAADQVIPAGWNVTVTPSALEVGPGQEATVTVDVVAPDGFSGAQQFNINAFDGTRLVGGVTLAAHS
jgi:hypothetical protein